MSLQPISRPLTLQTLPPETLDKIVSGFNATCLNTLALVSHQFKSLSENAHMWRKICHKMGLELNSSETAKKIYDDHFPKLVGDPDALITLAKFWSKGKWFPKNVNNATTFLTRGTHLANVDTSARIACLLQLVLLKISENSISLDKAIQTLLHIMHYPETRPIDEAYASFTLVRLQLRHLVNIFSTDEMFNILSKFSQNPSTKSIDRCIADLNRANMRLECTTEALSDDEAAHLFLQSQHTKLNLKTQSHAYFHLCCLCAQNRSNLLSTEEIAKNSLEVLFKTDWQDLNCILAFFNLILLKIDMRNDLLPDDGAVRWLIEICQNPELSDAHRYRADFYLALLCYKKRRSELTEDEIFTTLIKSATNPLLPQFDQYVACVELAILCLKHKLELLTTYQAREILISALSVSWLDPATKSAADFWLRKRTS